ncbi:MAG TPA: filamentous hemagglutinin N-terminal domain-containing protein [Nitrospira sp.]|nr:filamentous hemagglutinin N-terminal domain-containing protein [Nitrospira sp.]
MSAGCGLPEISPFIGWEVLEIKGNKGVMLNGSSARKKIPIVPNHSSWRTLSLSFTLSLLPLLWVPVSEGQTTSITSSGLGTTISPASIDPAGRPNYIITGGTRPGDGPNLFHSFGDFSVGTNNVARFFNEAGRSTTNILSRVTGGQTSNIYGTIQTAGFGTAALWLINPAGIVFGPSASLNVGGSVHFSTADYLRLGSGNDRFYADLGKTSQLTSAPVTAFGFLGERPAGPVTVQAGSPFAVGEGKTISLIGGDISVTGRTLSAPGGQINLASVAGGGEVVLNQVGQTPSLDLVNVSNQGTIQLTEGAILRTSSATSDAGAIFIRSGQFFMENAGLEAISTAPFDAFNPTPTGGAVDILSEVMSIKNGALDLPGAGSLPQGQLGFAGHIPGVSVLTNNSGDITLGTSTLSLNNAKILSYGQHIDSQFIAPDRFTGYIHIQGTGGAGSFADRVAIENSSLLHTAGFASDCNCTVFARDVRIQSNTVDMANSRISTNEGIIAISASNQILSHGNNTIAKEFGQRDLRGGENAIELTAGDVIVLGKGDTISTGAQGSSFTGGGSRAGDIVLNAPSITMNGTTLKADGNFTVNGGSIILRSGAIELSESQLSTNGLDGGIQPFSGIAGDILLSGRQAGVQTNTIHLTNSSLESAVLKSSQSSTAFGDSGNITLEGQHVTLDHSSVSVAHEGVGKSGFIMLSGGQVDFVNNSELISAASGKSIPFSSEFSRSAAAPGGDIAIQAMDISLAQGSRTKASSSGDGNAGAINLISIDSISIANSTVSTSATQASGGNIDLTAPNLVRLVSANVTSSVNGPANSNGGNITIDTAHPQFVIMQGNSQILAKANEGQGGAITIIGGVVLQEPGSVLDATAGPAGISGSINIQAPFQQLAGAIAPLPQAFAVAASLYGQRCATEKGGQFSSFVQGARDGVPPQPGDLIPSPLMLELDEAAFSRGSQSIPSLAAIRLGLPEFEQTSHSLTVFAGCRS